MHSSLTGPCFGVEFAKFNTLTTVGPRRRSSLDSPITFCASFRTLPRQLFDLRHSNPTVGSLLAGTAQQHVKSVRAGARVPACACACECVSARSVLEAHNFFFVFMHVSFNSLAKVQQECFDLWTRVLQNVPESRICLKSNVAFSMPHICNLWCGLHATLHEFLPASTLTCVRLYGALFSGMSVDAPIIHAFSATEAARISTQS